MAKTNKSKPELEKELTRARSTARNALQREKAYKKGLEEGMRLAKEGRS